MVLTGPNGAGKTNLLEAISYLAPGRGLRNARLAEAARIAPGSGAAASWSVAAEASGWGGPVTLGSGWTVPAEEGGAERRTVRIDGVRAAGPAALAERIGMVWLTPAMDRLFSGPPAERRRFLDRMVFAVDAAHAARVQRYDRARRHRTRLLRKGSAGRGSSDGAWLDALERGMAEHAAAIAAGRLDLVARIEPFLAPCAEPFPSPAIRVEGLMEGWLATQPALAAEERFREHLAASRRSEAEGESADGPQRSDLLVFRRGCDLPAGQCSTGEQKAMLIALVAAHARLLTHQRRIAPILLLDEIVAHLDEARRRALLEMVLDLGAQAWLTGTEPACFTPLGEAAQFFTVRPGAVVQEDRIG